MPVELGKFEGRPVRRASIAIRNTGDGLSAALKLEPEIIHGGEKRYVVIEVDVEKIRHDPMDEGDAWDRVHMAKALHAAFIPEGVARVYLDELAERIEAQREEDTGQGRLTESDARETEHLGGLHKRKRKTCPLCFPVTDADHAKVDELAAKRAEHGDGEGDEENPLPPAIGRHRTRGNARAKGATKKRGGRTPAPA